jgi:hypothetical protein
LVGDSDAVYLGGIDLCGGDRPSGCFHLACPDRFGVMLDPTRPWEELLKLDLPGSNNGPLVIKENSAG